MENKELLEVNSIFESINGEAGFIPQGAVTTFIRLQGCNLRCNWCDTVHGQEFNKQDFIKIDRVVENIRTLNVLITGGEPLARDKDKIVKLITALLEKRKLVQIETNGSFLPLEYKFNMFNIQPFWVMDRKCPSSGETDKMISVDDILKGQLRFTNLKYVIKDEKDEEWAKNDIEYLLRGKFPGMFIISPLNANPSKINELFNHFKNHPAFSRMIFSLQLHKITNMD